MFFLLVFCRTASEAQESFAWDDFVLFVTQDNEAWSENDEWAARIEELEQLHQNPIDINNATKEELSVLPLLNEQQVSDIRDYVERVNGLKSLLELRLIPSISYYTAQWLPLFVFIAPVEHQEQKKEPLLSNMKNELYTRLDLPLYHRRGYLVENGYRGSRLSSQTCYKLSSKHLKAGLRMEKDAGERGIDSYGAYAMLQNTGCINSIVIGDYQLGFGEGLVVNQGFSMGKSTISASPAQGIRAMNSADETHFMRGAAASLQLTQDFALTAFASHRNGDATLNENNEIKTVVTSGYHRTSSEYEKKNNFATTLVGGNLQWTNKDWNVGLTGYYQHYNRKLQPGDDAYRKYYPQGTDFGVIGVHYGYKTYLWSIRGESAYSTEKQGFATTHFFQIRTAPRWMFTLAQRYFQKAYYSTYASALCENSMVQNETGATISVEAQPIGSLNLNAYADIFYNPYPRYGLKTSSGGWEGMIMLSQNLTEHHSLSARYSLKNKMQSKNREHHHRLRLQWIATAATHWRFQTTALLHTVENSRGFAFSETIRYGLSSKMPLRASISATYFNTDDYNARVYGYEPNVTSSTTTMSFYGKGTRFSGTLQYQFLRNIFLLELKYGLTCYGDRETQGSALQTIYSKYKNDITLRLCIRIPSHPH